MNLSPILPFLLSTFLGVALTLNLAPSRRIRSIVLWASPVTGIGASSLLFYLWTLAFYPTFAPALYAGLELLIAILALTVFLRRSQPAEEPHLPFSSGSGKNIGTRLLGLVFGACLALVALVFVISEIKNPHGDWDAWTIWNMRARYLFLGGEQWRNAFSDYLHGADYPVLTSFYIARSWALAGRAPLIVPQILAGVFTLCTLGLLFTTLSKVRGMNQGLVAAIVLICTPSFLYWGVSQYADVPLGCFMLCATIFLYLFINSEPEKPGLLALTGLFTGFALWTKNEGIFLLAGVLAAALVFLLFNPERGKRLRLWTWFAAGVLPPLLLQISFKLFVAPPNYVLSQNGGSLLEKVTEYARYRTIFYAFRDEFLNFGSWRIPLIPLLLLYGLFVGINLSAVRKEKKSLGMLLVALVVVLIGYVGAYLVTPLPLDWQLGASLERLVLQVYPSALLLLFLALNNPLSIPLASEVRQEAQPVIEESANLR